MIKSRIEINASRAVNHHIACLNHHLHILLRKTQVLLRKIPFDWLHLRVNELVKLVLVNVPDSIETRTA